MDGRDDQRQADAPRNQAILAEFGSFALQSDDLDAVLEKACELVAEGLDEGLAKIVELQPDGRLYLRAFTGFAPEASWRWLEPGRGSSAGHSLMSGSATISADAPNDDRFVRAIVVSDAKVLSLINVLIPDPLALNGPYYGVLEVDSPITRDFTEEETAFLTLYANMIGAAVASARARERLTELVAEKERLLAELQHRVKNNIAVISGLVRIQARQAGEGEARRYLDQILARIETLRMVHDRLHSYIATDRIDIRPFLEDLVPNLSSFLGGPESGVAITITSDPYRMEADMVIPLGLLVNEFLTNSLKYAFSDDCSAEKRIGVRLQVLDGTARLILEDNGVGLPSDGGRPGGTGMSIIEGLAGQLGGTLKWGQPPGTSLSLEFPVT